MKPGIWLPMVGTFCHVSFTVLVPLPVSDEFKLHKPHDTKSSRRARISHQGPDTYFMQCTFAYWSQCLIWIWISLFMSVLFLKKMAFDLIVIHHNQPEWSWSWEVFQQGLSQHRCEKTLLDVYRRSCSDMLSFISEFISNSLMLLPFLLRHFSEIDKIVSKTLYLLQATHHPFMLDECLNKVRELLHAWCLFHSWSTAIASIMITFGSFPDMALGRGSDWLV